MTHTPYITLPYALERDAPPFEGNDIKSPESLSRWVIENHSQKDGKVFDPFVGLGTTMFMAEEMGRTPYGIEAEEQKFEWVAGQLEHWMNMICDDAFNVSKYDLPKMDLITTCPPFMKRTNQGNPLYGGDPKHAGYDKYIRRMGRIFEKLTPIMKKNTPLIIQLNNIKDKRGFTPLIHDIANALNKHFIQTDETIVQVEKRTRRLSVYDVIEFQEVLEFFLDNPLIGFDFSKESRNTKY